MKRIIPLILTGAVCLLFLTPLLKAPFYQSHDGENHVARFGAYHKAFSDMQIPPRFAGNLNFGYGTPVLNFFYPLPGYTASLLIKIGFSLEESFKVIAMISFILAPLFFYLWMRILFRDTFTSFFSSLLYGLAPYHFLDLYIRGDIGELLSFVFVPLAFLSVDLIAKKQRILYVLLGAISLGFLILSHNTMSLLFFLIILLYASLRIWQTRRRRHVAIYYVLYGILGLALPAFFWIPALFESQFTSASRLIGNMFQEHFPSITSLIYSAWGFGADVNKPFGLSPQIGPIHWGLVLSAAGFMMLKKKVEGEKLFWLVVFVWAVFMTLSVSIFLWDFFPIFKLFQFPWRFVAIASFAASVLGGFVTYSLPSKVLRTVLLGALLIFSLGYQAIQPEDAKPDSYYLSFPGTTFYHGEATTIWTAGDFGSFARKRQEVISGKARIESIMRKSNRHQFAVHADTDAQILDNTVYFPGWQVYVDGKKVPIEFQDINYRGLITLSVSQGTHNVVVRFGESPIRFVSDIITIVSILAVFVLWLIRRKIENMLRI